MGEAKTTGKVVQESGKQNNEQVMGKNSVDTTMGKQNYDINQSFFSFSKKGTASVNGQSWNVYKLGEDLKQFPNLGKIFQIGDKVYLDYVLYNRNIGKTNYDPEEIFIDITTDFVKCCPEYRGTNFSSLSDDTDNLVQASDCLSKKLEYLSFAKLFIEE